VQAFKENELMDMVAGLLKKKIGRFLKMNQPG
jgi:hypothetical protein